MAVDESETSISSTDTQTRETAHDTSDLEDIEWVRYTRQTERDEAKGIYRVITGIGVFAFDTHPEDIELAGFHVEAITSASDYGLEIYVSPIEG